MAQKPSRKCALDKIGVRGATAPSGTKWVRIRQGPKAAWIPRATFMTSIQDVKHRLADADIIALGADWSSLVGEVARMRRFPAKPLLEQPGWTGSCFALPNGEVFAPPGVEPVCLFPNDQQRCASLGTLRGWKRRIADPLAEQLLASFMLMVPFVAPLLRLTARTGNFGFELIGPKGTGKTTLLHLMASTIGGGADGCASRYWSTCNTTVNAIEHKAETHSDLPLLLDDATAFAATDGAGARARAFKSFVFALAQGETKHRLIGAAPRSFRLVYTLTSNLPLADVISSMDDRESGATADRLLTLDVGLREAGIFDYLPWEYSDATAFARALVDGMSAEYGTAMPAFLRRLVDHRASDEARLRAGIRERTDGFLERVNIDRSDGSAIRVAEAFGLVLAAGKLAQHYGVLPRSFECEVAAEAVYRLYQASTTRESHLDRLLAYLGSPNVIDMDRAGLTHLSKEQFETAPAFCRRNRRGESEYLIVPATLQSAFPDHRRLLEDAQVARLLKREGRHKTVKRPVRRGGRDERVYCITVPEASRK